MSDRTPLTQWLVLALAVVLLDAALTFHNVWPTPWIAPTLEMSVELGVLLLCVVAWVGWRGGVSGAARVALALLLLLLVIGRYAEVTAPALYGRPVNFYWDAQHLPAVGAMLAKVAPWWMIAALGVGVVAFFATLALVLGFALGRVTNAVQARTPRRVIAGVGAALVAGHALSNVFDWPLRFYYALPVSAT